MIRIAVPIAALLSAACVPQAGPQVPADPAPPAGPCDVTGLDDLIGKSQSEKLAAEALRRSGSRSLRWIAPGMAVTMDYRTDRLNIHIDDKGRITDLRCG